jgi:hypothetical protein
MSASSGAIRAEIRAIAALSARRRTRPLIPAAQTDPFPLGGPKRNDDDDSMDASRRAFCRRNGEDAHAGPGSGRHPLDDAPRVVGAFVAYYAGRTLGFYADHGQAPGLIASVLGAMLLLGVYRLVTRTRGTL